MAALQSSEEIDTPLEATPPWGYSPVERYVLTHWDTNSTLSTSDQRLSLIRKFLAADALARIGQPPDINDHDNGDIFTANVQIGVTEGQIRDILAPWRSLRQREAAIYYGESVTELWIRTCYTEGSDEKFQELVEEGDLDTFDTLDSEDPNVETLIGRILNNKAQYDFGADWKKILDVMPEIVVRPEPRKQIAELRRACREMLDQAGGVMEDMDQRVWESKRNLIQGLCVANYMVIIDQEALDTGNLLFAFLDNHGDLVTQVRLPACEAQEVSGGWSARGVDRWYQYVEDDGEPGPKYEMECEAGRELYFGH
ncbi:hypothetical protein BJ508DRAFT_418867 [Ascobolus immersus RN42]|uniref:Uncharacterized protein n=1 Tax=Ascobolus immersus RN42 TaxID=1160509 RepID=A0A3N4HLT6_ASCIM|nr:hypothetical protein BJ508DRAFT_418867 [Ascobolus immersus RN42]